MKVQEYHNAPVHLAPPVSAGGSITLSRRSQDLGQPGFLGSPRHDRVQLLVEQAIRLEARGVAPLLLVQHLETSHKALIQL